MASINGTQVGFFTIGPYDVLSSRASVDYETRTPAKDKTPLGTSAVVKEFLGVESASISHTGWFDETTGSIVTALLKSNRSRSSQVVCLGVGGNTVGAEALCLSGALTGSYKRGVQVEDFHKADVDMESSGAVDDNAKVLAPLTAHTDATWSTASVDHGAATTAGLAAYLVITALTLGGYTSVDVLVEHSANNSTWATLVAFTVATAAGVERKAVASGGTINRYLRVSCAYTGAGTGQSVTALVCAERY